MFYLVCKYLDIIQKMKPASNVFEGERLLACEVKQCVELTIMELEQCKDSAGTNEEFLGSNFNRFEVNNEEHGTHLLFGTSLMAGNATKAPVNPEFTTHEFKETHYIESSSRSKASNAKVEVINDHKKILKMECTASCQCLTQGLDRCMRSWK